MKLVLAPLAGFTDAAFRRLCVDGGADLTHTEMVSAAGLAHGSSPTRHLMETLPGEGPVVVQLFGAREADLAFAARVVERDFPGRFAAVNLNAGCPMTKVTREGAGAKLVERPETIHRLLKALTENTSLPVTVKTRLGPHPKDLRIFEILDAAEQAGARGLDLHARFTSQMHGGPVHLDLLAEVVRRAKIPITGNGSVVSLGSYERMASTGVAGVMVGRAALGDPYFFARLKDRHATVPKRLEVFRRHLDLILDARDRLAAKYPNDHIPSRDAIASLKARTHLFRYAGGVPGAAALRARINAFHTLDDVLSLLTELV